MWEQSQKFWAASDAGFSRVASSPELARVWNKWVSLSRQPDRRKKQYRFVDTRLSTLPATGATALAIRLDPTFRNILVDIDNKVTAGVVEELDRYMASVAFNAWRKWPVDSGFSKALISLEYIQTTPGVIVGELHSNAWYSFYIKSKRNGLGGKQPWRVLIFDFAKSKVSSAAINIARNVSI